MASFYCQLCQKGYSRHNEYEAHLSSYDHSHKVRLKEMRAMTRDPTAAARARKAEAKADGVISIQLGAGGAAPAGGGFKKGGFKKSGFKSAFAPVGGDETAVAKEGDAKRDEGVVEEKVKSAALMGKAGETVESDTEDEGYEMYDPRFPTD